jgi:predicted SAM-dependent methyltransferase
MENKNNKLCVQYGCGLSAPKEWLNFDASPTLRIQKNIFLKYFIAGLQDTKFPDNVKYGDIIKGLPVKPGTCDAVYCSHVLEHLSLSDFRKALTNTYNILKPGGAFRLVMPDLHAMAEEYIKNKINNTSASIDFIKNTGMGLEFRARGFKTFIKSFFGNSRHLWLWDYESTIAELEKTGFKNIRKCKFNDSSVAEFKLVEDEGRFSNAIALEITR